MLDQSLTAPAATTPIAWIRTKLQRLWANYAYLILAGAIPALLMYLLYVVHLVHPFGDESVLVLDLTGQYIFFFEKLRDILTGESSLLYSFTRSLGGEFMGIFDYYVASPLSVIVALFPKEKILDAMLVLFILKTGLCGFNMGFFLSKISTKSNGLSIVTFSVMYALTSYAVVYQHNTMWLDAVMWLPILAYAIQELIKRERFRLYVFTLAIILISNFYIGYMVCIFTVIYCLYYYFAHDQHNENNPTGEKHHLWRSFLRVLGWSLLAVGIAAFIILSAYRSLSFGKNEFTTPDWSIEQKFELFEFFYKFLPGTYDTVTPRGLPLVYCGVLTLLLAPAFFLCKKFSNREKVAAACVIMVFIVSMVVSPLDMIWHGFQKPQWLNARYSFMLCFFLLMLAFRAFEQLEFISRKSLLGVAAFIALFVLIAQQLSGTLFTEALEKEDVKEVFRPYATVWLSLACLFVYFLIIALRGRVKPRFKEGLSMALLVVVCVEVFLNGVSSMMALDKDVTYSGYSKYNNFLGTFRPVVDAVKAYDDGFYRMEKTYYQKKDDNFALNINGISECTSTFNDDTQQFLQDIGYWSESNYTMYVGGTVVTDSLLGIKYLIYSDEVAASSSSKRYDYYSPYPEQYFGEAIFSPEDYDYDEDFEPIRNCYVYENPYALSWAYGVDDDWLSYSANDYFSPFHRVNAMITAMLGEDELIEVYKPAIPNGEPTLTDVTKKTSIRGTEEKSCYTYSGKNGKITYSYTVPTDTELFVFLPYSTNPNPKYTDRRQVELKLNGGVAKNHHTSNTNRIVAMGTSDTENATLSVTLKSDNLYLFEDYSYLYYIDMEVFEDVMARLAAMPQLTIDKDSTDDHLTGSMTTTEASQLIFTSITYDEGWNVYVDGERVETQKAADALMTFSIDNPGEHTIEMRYMPSSYALGIACSIICTVIFVLLLIGYRWLRRVPVVKHIMGIQRPDLPAVDSPEMILDLAPGDIGAGDDIPSAPPDGESNRRRRTGKRR